MIEINEKLFKERLNLVANTDDGKIVLAYLSDVLGWNDIMINLDERSQATLYHQTRRGVYGWLRSFINKENLKTIEFNFQRKAVTNGTSDTDIRGAKRTRTTKRATKPAK